MWRDAGMIMSFDKLTQVALVVRDLRNSMKHFWEDLGVGPWNVWTLDRTSMSEMMLRGQPAEFSIKVGMSKIEDVQVELVQPLEGQSIFREHLDRKGEGLHHLKYSTDNPIRVLDEFKRIGCSVLQSARIGEGSFYYIDTEPMVGFILELSSGRALKNKSPDEVYPSK